ncbi:MAG TPA: hypothetical protein VF256_00115, partial [Streptosporangiaceae bacterium]
MITGVFLRYAQRIVRDHGIHLPTGGNLEVATRGETMIERLVPAMVEICGPDGVVTDPLDLRTY